VKQILRLGSRFLFGFLRQVSLFRRSQVQASLDKRFDEISLCGAGREWKQTAVMFNEEKSGLNVNNSRIQSEFQFIFNPEKGGTRGTKKLRTWRTLRLVHPRHDSGVERGKRQESLFKTLGTVLRL
jgi:hypothetical protein